MFRIHSVLAFLLPAALLAPASAARADCTGDEAFCAEAEIHIGGSLSIGRPAPPPRSAQVVVVEESEPEPPVVIVQPAPPPPPQVVVQAPPPPPPPPVQTRTTSVTIRRTTTFGTGGRFGIHGRIGGMFSDRVHMGGATAAFRFRPIPHLALDFGIGAYGGEDYNGLERVEVPLTVDMLLYVNPQHRFQLYFVGGVGVSAAHVEGVPRDGRDYISREYTYGGGQLGAGLEWRVARHFALVADFRGFLRKRIDDEGGPEFFRVRSDGTTQSTDVSGGGTFHFGGTIYF